MLSNQNQIASILNFPQKIPNDESNKESVKISSLISSDSTNESNLNMKKHKYIFENDKKSYIIYLILVEEKIKIKVSPKIQEKDEYYYERDFSQEELKQINKVFKLCNNIEDSYNYLNDLFNENQSQINISEENDLFKIEKKIQLSLPLKIEIPKKYKNKNNINVNNTNINIDKEINKKSLDKNVNSNSEMELKEKNTDNIIPKKEFLEKEEKIKYLSKNLCIINNFTNFISVKNKEEKKKNNNIFLNKKRGSTSNLSDNSFNSNENEFNNRKSKNNLDKENFLKIFSDNISVKSNDSNEKFFMRILKQKKLEKDSFANLDKNKNNNEENNNKIMNNKKEEENVSYLYGDIDSSDEIKDDIDFFNNNIPLETAKGPNNNLGIINNIVKNNNDSSLYLNKVEKNKSLESLFRKDSIFNKKESLFYKSNNNLNNKKNQFIFGSENIFKQNNKDNYEEIIKNDSSSDYSANNSNNMISNVYEKDSFYKKNNSYKIINEKHIEYCDIDSYYGFKDKKQYSSQLFSLDSKILLNYGEFDFILNYLKTKFNKQIISSIRIYRATEDGDKAETFHRLCDGNTNIIILIKTKDGKKFGGFTSIGFSNINQSVLDETAFVFSINKREIYPNKKGQKAVESHKNLGPTFSGDIIKIYDNFLKSGGITSRKGLNYHTTEDFQINDGNKYFYVEEIEVLEFLEMKVE